MPGTSGLVLLLFTYPGIDNMSNLSLLNCRLFSVGCMHFPHVQYTIPISQYEAQSGHCLFEEVSLNSKISVLPISVIKSFDSWLKRLISSDFSKSFSNIFLFGWFSNCSINRLTVSLRFVFTFSTVECGMPGIRKSTRLLLQVSLCLWTSFSQSSDFLESVISTSFWSCCEFGTSVTRGSLGDWYTLE